MPRTSRAVAQRLASQAKSRKRRSQRPGAPAPTVDQILDEVVPSEAGPRAAATPSVAPAPAPTDPPASAPAAPRERPPTTRRSAATTAGRAGTRPAPVRRRYAEYAAEYAYVWTDLRRILLVAGSLIALLVVLWFFIQ